MAAPNGKAEILYRCIQRGGKNGRARNLIAFELGWTSKQIDGAAHHLIDRGLVVRIGRLTWRVTKAEPAFGRHTPILARSDKRGANAQKAAQASISGAVASGHQPGQKKRASASADSARGIPEPDISRATIIRDTRQWPTARWQMLPDEPPIGFSRLPLGATLDGWRV